MDYEQIAAVDLGSNSFRLQIGRVVDDQIYPLDGLKEAVRLAGELEVELLLREEESDQILRQIELDLKSSDRVGLEISEWVAMGERIGDDVERRCTRFAEQFANESVHEKLHALARCLGVEHALTGAAPPDDGMATAAPARRTICAARRRS